MTTNPVDTRMALDAADASDLVQRKLAVDGLKKRLGDGKGDDKKLREACEGFESIFLQKMWEQMRKNVKKEGYLHSKDEEAYQSMFDVELAKKMTSAGGIGLADMLQQQLSQKLHNTSRSTGSGSLRAPLSIPAAEEAAKAAVDKQKPGMTQDELYTRAEEEAQKSDYDPAGAIVEQALNELANERRQMDPDRMPALAFMPMTVAQAYSQPVPAPAAPAAVDQAAAAATGERRPVAVTPMPPRVSAPGKARPASRRGMSSRKQANNRSMPARAMAAPGYPQLSGQPAAVGAPANQTPNQTAGVQAPAAGGVANPAANSRAMGGGGGFAAPAGAQPVTADGGVAGTPAPALSPARLDRNV